ncbi:MAG: aminoacetone oxidase family FAD-binding enzyme [Lachnospiraceae bacterium]|nr:aminoacetone oxidase family FAD-binding enzyme [Lachnospiraceae bacterium]
MSGRGKISVIGGGMSGICAAILLARAGYKVTIYERQDRIGKKILLTGNGRCNLSNEDINSSFYQSPDNEKLKRVLDNMSISERDVFYKSLGISTCNIRGGIYPVSRQASSVIDALRFTLRELNVNIVTGAKAISIRKDLSIVFEDRNITAPADAEAVIIACGGKAGVYSEDKENGFKLLEGMGHSLNLTYPALTHLKCEEDLKAVAGVRCDAALSLKTDEGTFRETGELQLNKDSVSGIPVFQLSRYCRELSGISLEADFLCFLSDPRGAYDTRIQMYAGRQLEEFFAGWLNKKLAQYLIKRSGLRPSDIVRECDMKKLYRTLTHCSFKINGRGNYREAQLMCGGVPLSEVSDSLESLRMKRVYLLGELLDVNGACGGYNLHFALCSAFAAYKAINTKGAAADV